MRPYINQRFLNIVYLVKDRKSVFSRFIYKPNFGEGISRQVIRQLWSIQNSLVTVVTPLTSTSDAWIERFHIFLSSFTHRLNSAVVKSVDLDVKTPSSNQLEDMFFSCV